MAAKSQFKNLSGFTREKENSSNIFGQTIIGDIPEDDFNEKYMYEIVKLEDIILDEVIDVDDKLYQSIKTAGVVNPIWLSFDYIMAEKAGREYKKKTGKYRILDGNKRVAAANKIIAEGGHDRLKNIQALILPIKTSEEEIENIKQMLHTEENQNRSTSDLISVVNSSKGAQITYGYRYENADIPFDLIYERDNKYPATESEIESLANSIYKYGLFQDIMVLPEVNPDTMEVIYRLEAGHKRRKAIKLLLDKARAGQLENGASIIANYSSVPAKLLPMGATKEQIEAVYNESNIHSRKMTTDSFFAHLSYFSSIEKDANATNEFDKYIIPKVPTTEEEYKAFIGNVKISYLIPDLQQELKKLGFADWKNRKMTQYLNIYFFGCDKLKEMCVEMTQHPDKKPPIILADMEWIAITYKGFDEREKQEEIIEKALEDKAYLVALKGTTKVQKSRTKKVTTQYVAKKVISEVNTWSGLLNADIEEVKTVKDDYEKIITGISDMKKMINKFEKRIKELNGKINEE